MKHFSLIFFAIVALAAAQGKPQGKQTFTGIITDDECPKADHSQMAMGPTDAACTIACVADHGALYLLYDGEHAYTLSDQRTPEKFAAQKVRVIGTLDGNTNRIQVESITAAK